MKLVDGPAEWIIIKARNNSEWDSVDFALVCFRNKVWREWVMNYIKEVERWPVGSGFYNISLWSGPEGWYSFGHAEEVEIPEKGWSYVELEEDEIETFSVPENKLRGDQLKLFSDGTARFVVYGDYTGEEFWTEDIPLKQLLEKYNELAKV